MRLIGLVLAHSLDCLAIGSEGRAVTTRLDNLGEGKESLLTVAGFGPSGGR